MRKAIVLLLPFALPLMAQSVLLCGTSKGCVFAGLGGGISYDSASNRLVGAPAKPLPVQVDTFRIVCDSSSSPVNCANGTPSVSFTTSRPVSNFILALRAIAQSEGPTNDYTHTVNPDGTWTITFAVPADTGNVVLLYQ